MGAPIAVREDFWAEALRLRARQTSDANQARRLLALAVITRAAHAAMRRGSAVSGLQIVRDWVVLFNAEGCLTG